VNRLVRVRSAAFVCLFAGVVALLPAGPASAGYQERQREIQKQIADKQAKIRADELKELELERQIANSDARRTDLRARLRGLLAQLVSARAQLDVLEAKIDGLSKQLDVETSKLEATQAQLDRQTQIFNSRVANIYINAPSALARGYQFAQDYSDLLVGREYEAGTVRADIAFVGRIEATKRQIELQQEKIQSAQQLLIGDRRETIGAAQHIANIRQSQTQAALAVQAEIAKRTQLLEDVRKEKQAYERALRELQAESRAIEAFLRQRQGGGRVIRGIGGWLKWPVSGPITSPFGWRIHPVFHTRSFHTGIDIGVPTGTPVGAARGGTILDTGYRGGYGNVVIIDHGNHIATVYAHLSRIFVSVGQRVSGGQNVGAAGMTGWATGPHLHFEVRSSGVATNPLGWL
jgi:murein DD-endopeptidase MepM/ murein hydrolase activator NlpD